MGRPIKYRTEAERRKAHVKCQQDYRKRRKRSVHFRSDTDAWSTPQAVFEVLNAEFHFTLDVCADATNAKCPQYLSVTEDGLKHRWQGVCWMNPPYGDEIPRWVQKAYEASLYGVTVVCLLPARTDTRWWQAYVLPCAEIRYVPGRLKFGGAANSAPFPSAVVIFRPIAGSDGGSHG